MGGVSEKGARETSFSAAIASTVAQSIGRPATEITIVSLVANSITKTPLNALNVHLVDSKYEHWRALAESKNVSVIFSLGVVGGVSDTMITKLNDAVNSGSFASVLSRFSGLTLTVTGFFTLVYIVAENLRNICKLCYAMLNMMKYIFHCMALLLLLILSASLLYFMKLKEGLSLAVSLSDILLFLHSFSLSQSLHLHPPAFSFFPLLFKQQPLRPSLFQELQVCALPLPWCVCHSVISSTTEAAES